MDKVRIPAWRCRHCQHRWRARIDRKPVKCPRCFSTTWDLKRKEA